MNSARQIHGFTLLEVTAALAIVAFSMAALWHALSQAVVVSQQVPDRVAARWVAENRMILRQARGEWPPTRTFTGTQQLAGRTWHWREQVIQTEEPLLRRIVVEVRADAKAAVLFTLEGYVARPRAGRNQQRGQRRRSGVAS